MTNSQASSPACCPVSSITVEERALSVKLASAEEVDDGQIKADEEEVEVKADSDGSTGCVLSGWMSNAGVVSKTKDESKPVTGNKKIR